MPCSKQAGLSTLLRISLLLGSNTLEQNTEQKLCMGFPYKTQEEYAAFRAGLQTNQGVSLQRWPVHLCGLFSCSLPSRGFFLTLCCVRAVCPHLAVAKALCSLKCFDLGFFFLTCQSNPDNVGCKAKQLSAVLRTLGSSLLMSSPYIFFMEGCLLAFPRV